MRKGNLVYRLGEPNDIGRVTDLCKDGTVLVNWGNGVAKKEYVQDLIYVPSLPKKVSDRAKPQPAR